MLLKSSCVKIAALLGAVAFFFYLYSFNAAFVLDDYPVILENYSLQHLNLGAIWNYDPSRFLTHLTFALNFYFGQFNPYGYHVINFLIHWLNAVVVYLLVLKLMNFRYSDTQKNEHTAILTGLIFIVHPIQTSAVTYIAQRSTLLATLFYLSSLLLASHYFQHKKVKYLIFSMGTAFLGVFCKPIIFTLPLMMFVISFWFNQKESIAKRLKSVFPFLMIVLLVPVLLSLWKYHSVDPSSILKMTSETQTITRPVYFFTQMHVIWVYIKLLFFPVSQNLDYNFQLITSMSDPTTLFAMLAHVSFIGLGIWMLRRRSVIGIALLWFYIGLSLESSFFPIKDVIFEHRLYLPMMGFSLMISYLIIFKIKKEVVQYVYISILLFSLGILTSSRNVLWSNQMAFLQDIVEHSPGKARAHNNLGYYYMENGELSKALIYFDNAVHLDHQYFEAFSNRGKIYFLLNDYKNAMKNYQKALIIDPRHARTLTNRGYLYFLLGEKEKAMQDLEKAIEIDSTMAGAFNNRGIIYLSEKNYAKALEDFKHAVELNLYMPEAWNNLGVAWINLGNKEQAYQSFFQAVQLDPHYVSARNNLEAVRRMP